MENLFLLMIGVLPLLLACTEQASVSRGSEDKPASFAEDLEFLKKYDDRLLVLSTDSGEGQIIVSPRYQAKVFTSTAAGNQGRSFGWINYEAFDQETDPHMNAYGGEDRLWLGPEGGPFSLFFEEGDEMIFDNWHTPSVIDTDSWKLLSAENRKAVLSVEAELKNYAGTVLPLRIDREINILENPEIESLLSVSLGSDVKVVGFRTENTLTNTGEEAWDEESGAPCLWSLDMFTPSPETVIVIPYEEDASGKIATTDYFGEIPKDRIKTKDGILYFKADGLSRGKLGIPPQRVRPVAGSYAADIGVLTITFFDVHPEATYLNQEWTTEKDPLTGDAMNAYNDGPLEDGSQMGPFYEIESVSPAAFLRPGEKITHRHSVFHFTGGEESLRQIAQEVLGVSLKQISSAFS